MFFDIKDDGLQEVADKIIGLTGSAYDKHRNKVSLSTSYGNSGNLTICINSPDNKKTLATVTLEFSEGLPAFISTKLAILPEYRGGWAADKLDELKEALSRKVGVKTLMASVSTTNYPELARMFKKGWKAFATVTSRHNEAEQRIMFFKDL